MSERTQPSAAPADSSRRRDIRPWLAIALALATQVGLLRAEGRRWWCACGQPTLWTGDANGPHNSQHLFDPYSLTHVLHGLILCGVLSYALPRLAPAWRLVVAVVVEVGWELVENTNFVIERYRTATLALGYQGDTVANSVGDVLSCVLGFVVARRIGLWPSVVLFAVTEAVLLVWIRDSLFLSTLMLIHPIDAIKAWQTGP
jgi:Protein of unknown function (DUF2585)